MRILLVSHRYLPHSRGGVETWTRAMCSGLRAAGHEVAVLSRDHREGGGAPFSWHRVLAGSWPVYWLRHRLSLARSHRDTWNDPRLLPALAQIYDDFGPDLVHLGHPDGWGITPLEVARERGLATAATLHDYKWLCARGQMLHPSGERCQTIDEERCVRCVSDQLGRSGARALASRIAPAAVRRWAFGQHEPSASAGADPGRLGRQRWRTAQIALLGALRDCDVVFAPSHFVARRHQEQGLSREVVVIGNGLEGEVPSTAAPQPRWASARWASARDGVRGPLRIGFFGNNHPSKGLAVLQKALRSLPASSVLLEIHGPEKVAESGVPWSWHGAYDHDQVLGLMAAVDLVAIPSLWDENQPMVALEAHAAGKPLLVSDVGGLPELVSDGEDGWIVAAGDPEAWGEAIALLAADRQGVRNAAHRVASPASAETMAFAYLRAYGRALGKETLGPALTAALPVEDNVDSRLARRAEPTADEAAHPGAPDGQ
jgi:glycosyltransferase involved in cell wall biosynthesis